MAVYDATNISVQRRAHINGKLLSHGINPIFLEIISTNPSQIEQNLLDSARHCIEYQGLSIESATSDIKVQKRNGAAQYGYCLSPMTYFTRQPVF